MSTRAVSNPRPPRRLPFHTPRRLVTLLGVSLALAVSLAMIPGLVRAQSGGLVGVKTYYLGLGDSLAFGYQPDFDWSHGYVQQWYPNLQKHGSKSLTNYGCPGETANTFINGGCPYWYLVHNFYVGAQLSAAVSFIKGHAGQVSPVSLDIGANDLLPDINTSNCTVSSSWSTDLSTLDGRLKNTILPQLVNALTNSTTHARTGDLVMMDYYDPYQNICPNSVSYVQQLDTTIDNDAAAFNVPVARVFAAFGGPSTPNPNICSYTWMCSIYNDIHATQAGYGVIAGAYESVTGY